MRLTCASAQVWLMAGEQSTKAHRRSTMSYAAKSPRQESNLPLPRSRRSNHRLRHRPGLLIAQRRSQAASLHYILPHCTIRKTGQGTTENGVWGVEPRCQAASTEKKHPFSSPLTELVAGGKGGYGLFFEYESKKPWLAPPSKLVMDRLSGRSNVIATNTGTTSAVDP